MKKGSLLLMCGGLMSCITVNIYFPAAAAEKAADKIIQDVWKDKVPDQSKIEKINPARTLALILLNAISTDAYAQEVDFNATSPEIEKIKSSMAKRFKNMEVFFNQGIIGLSGDGFVAVRDMESAAMPDRAKINQLVKAENNDRKALYKAIADANNQPSWVAEIQKTFASRWISQAYAGWYYQKGGQWVQK